MKLFDKLLFYISVPKCVSCGERLLFDERALCGSCLEKHLEHEKRNCSRCAKILSECTCSNDYLEAHRIKRLIKLFRYAKADIREDTPPCPSNALIYSLKRDNREDVLKLLSDELTEAIRASVNISEDFVITSVPRRPRAIRKYGIDHAYLLARAVSKSLGVPYVKLMRSTAKLPQKKTHDDQRLKNATFKLLRRHADIKDKRVIIVDDIVTTGASLGACANIIHALHAKEIIGAVISIAYHDKNIDFNGGILW